MTDIIIKINAAADDQEAGLAWKEWYDAAAVGDFKGEQPLHVLDPLLKISFARFLSKTHEYKAVGFLVRLMQDPSPPVAEAAWKAFEGNRFAEKIHLLTPLILSPLESVRDRAVDRLAAEGVTEAIPFFLFLLKSADENLLLRLLSALRQVPHARTLRPVSAFLGHPRPDVRLGAVFVVGALYQKRGTRLAGRHLRKAVDDPDARVRAAAVWCLRRVRARRDSALFDDLLHHDPDPRVRAEALTGLALFPTRHTIRTLINVFLYGGNADGRLDLKAERVLMNLPAKKILGALRHEIGCLVLPATGRALCLLAQHPNPPPCYFGYLVRRLRHARDDRQRVCLIEVLGVLRDGRAVPVLEEFLSGPAPLAYAAALALLNVKGEECIRYLLSPSLSPVLRQTVLRQIAAKGMKRGIRADEHALLEGYIHGDNRPLRYLAAALLAEKGGRKEIETLLKVTFPEADLQTKKALHDLIVQILKRQGEFAPHLVRMYKDKPRDLVELLGLLGRADLSGDQCRGLFAELVNSPHLCDKGVVEFIGCLIMEGRLTFEEVLGRLAGRRRLEPFVFPLSEALCEAKIPRQLIHDELIEACFHQIRPRLRPTFVRLLARGGVAQAAGLAFKLLFDESRPHLRYDAAFALRVLAEAPV